MAVPRPRPAAQGNAGAERTAAAHSRTDLGRDPPAPSRRLRPPVAAADQVEPGLPRLPDGADDGLVQGHEGVRGRIETGPGVRGEPVLGHHPDDPLLLLNAAL